MLLAKISRAVAYVKILTGFRKATYNNLNDWDNSLTNPTNFYLDAFRFFYFSLPSPLRAHKYYFTKNARGFGEKAFHTMWYFLYKKYHFVNFLEIGIYRGRL